MTRKTAEKSKGSPDVMASIHEEGEEEQTAREAEDSLESRTPTKRKPETQQKGRK